MASTRSTRQITQPPRPNVVRDEAERYRHARQAAAQLDAELLAARRAGHPRIPRLPAGCDQQGRHPQAAEACTEVGADAPRNDASLWREWCDFIESLLPPGVRIGSMLRGLFWIAVAFALVGGGVALAVSALRGGIGT